VTTSSQLPPAISISTRNEEAIEVSCTTTLFSGPPVTLLLLLRMGIGVTAGGAPNPWPRFGQVAPAYPVR